MTDRILDGIQAATKTITTVGTTIGVFSLELLLLEKAVPFHGAARFTTALSKAGRIMKIPTMAGGLSVMVGTSAWAGHEAGEAVYHLFNKLRGRDNPRLIVVDGAIE